MYVPGRCRWRAWRGDHSSTCSKAKQRPQEYFRDDVWPLLGQGELVVVLVALYEVEDEVPDVEGSVPHSSAMIPS
jgi:hypothetical protein